MLYEAYWGAVVAAKAGTTRITVERKNAAIEPNTKILEADFIFKNKYPGSRISLKEAYTDISELSGFAAHFIVVLPTFAKSELSSLPVVVDSHEDIASSSLMLNRDFLLDISKLRAVDKNIEKEGTPTVCLPELIRGNVRVVFATLWAAPGGYSDTDFSISYSTPEEAHAQAQNQLDFYRKLERNGHIRIIETRTRAGRAS